MTTTNTTLVHLDLDATQVEVLSDLLASTLRDMHYEIAATDSPRFRADLQTRRVVLESVRALLPS